MSRARALALVALVATAVLVAAAWVGRAVLSADDGYQMTAEALGFCVEGRLESANMPPARVEPNVPPPPAFHSWYGIAPSIVPLPFVAAAWTLRHALGAAGVDAVISLTWAVGALLAALAFFRLARELRADVSPLWVPAFLGGTFLWTYVADSYVETYTAAGFAFAGAAILSRRERPAPAAALAVAAGCIAAYLLRPVDWVTAPAVVLSALVAWRARPDGARRGVWLLFWLASGLALHGVLNLVRNGSVGEFGYGFSGTLPFTHPVVSAIADSLFFPGRGLLLYAPIVVASLVAFRRLGWAERLLCFGVPLSLLLVVGRWFVWHAGTCWGPRFLLPVLPLLAAPAVLAPKRLAAALLALGAVVNLPGVLVASGAWQSYAERLVPPAGAAWPAVGGDRVSDLPALSPLYGHVWLLSRAFGGPALPAPWLSRGAREGMAPPTAAACVSPWIVRRAWRLPPIPPMAPRILVRSAAAYLVRGRPAEAARAAGAALEIDPRDREAVFVLARARRTLARP